MFFVLLKQSCTEMDGVVGRKQIYVVGATNRPDIIDRLASGGYVINSDVFVMI
jgi:SpoVK/Ycf46/Vps4 family AAA+-type ATPase